MNAGHELAAFKVTRRGTGKSYYLRAKAATQALELVTMKLGDVAGRSAWEVVSEAPPFPLEPGVLCDASGHTIHPVDY